MEEQRKGTAGVARESPPPQPPAPQQVSVKSKRRSRLKGRGRDEELAPAPAGPRIKTDGCPSQQAAVCIRADSTPSRTPSSQAAQLLSEAPAGLLPTSLFFATEVERGQHPSHSTAEPPSM